MRILVLTLLLFKAQLCIAQHDWVTFNAAYQKNKQPILLYFYTDWCNVCKIQARAIEKSMALQEKLNTKHYYIPINGESDEEIPFLGESYFPKGNARRKATHELVYAFFSPQEVAYPLWIILNTEQEIIGKYQGFIKADALEKILDQINSRPNNEGE